MGDCMRGGGCGFTTHMRYELVFVRSDSVLFANRGPGHHGRHRCLLVEPRPQHGKLHPFRFHFSVQWDPQQVTHSLAQKKDERSAKDCQRRIASCRSLSVTEVWADRLVNVAWGQLRHHRHDALRCLTRAYFAGGGREAFWAAFWASMTSLRASLMILPTT